MTNITCQGHLSKHNSRKAAHMSSSGFYSERGYFPYRRLEELLRGAEGERIRSLDDLMQRAEPVNTVTVLTISSSSLYRIGSIATDTDREFRRAAAIIGQGPEGRHDYDFGGDRGLPPRPIHPVDGGLLVRDASTGSLHLLVELYGEVQTLMLSRPVSTLVSGCHSGGRLRSFASLA